MAAKVKPGRNWACKFYPETIDFRTLLEGLDALHVPCAVSPLHDADVYDVNGISKWRRHNPDAPKEDAPRLGEPLKPHWHVLFALPGNKTAASMVDMLSDILMTDGPRAGSPAVAYVERVESLPAYTRYLAHLDNGQKHLYDPGEVLAFGGFDLAPLDGTDTHERAISEVSRVCKLVQARGITNFADLVDFALSEDDRAFDTVVSRSAFFGMWLSARAGRAERARDVAAALDERAAA